MTTSVQVKAHGEAIALRRKYNLEATSRIRCPNRVRRHAWLRRVYADLADIAEERGRPQLALVVAIDLRREVLRSLPPLREPSPALR
jgi:predicted GNAT superfamily acetyltransferase